MGWFGRRGDSEPPVEADDDKPEFSTSWKDLWPVADASKIHDSVDWNAVKERFHEASIDEQMLSVGVLMGTSFLLGVGTGRMRPFAWARRYTNVSDISSSQIGAEAPYLRGRALTVSDGDTFRFLHTPTVFHSTKLKPGEKLSEVALPIRVCTIDTPEVAKFGAQGQPFGEEAKERLAHLVQDRTIQIKLLMKDQYGRGVAQVRVPSWIPFWPNYADEIMLQAGLAEVYRGGGAVYGLRGKDAYEAMEEKAKRSRRGIWSQGDRESAAEYKQRQKTQK